MALQVLGPLIVLFFGHSIRKRKLLQGLMENYETVAESKRAKEVKPPEGAFLMHLHGGTRLELIGQTDEEDSSTNANSARSFSAAFAWRVSTNHDSGEVKNEIHGVKLSSLKL
ncbi:hypothetical protein B0J14DRAFT_556933 [Halenospora varia]|nr:hypothetical protein B0J14DRAFT_556933 [Halenospora varia]